MMYKRVILFVAIAALTFLIRLGGLLAEDSTQNSKDSTTQQSKKQDSTKALTDSTAKQPAAKDTTKAVQDTTKKQQAESDSSKAVKDTTTTQEQIQDSVKVDADSTVEQPEKGKVDIKPEADSLPQADTSEAARDSIPEEAEVDDSTAVVEDTTAAAEPPKHNSVGAKRCKICHKDVYDSWINTGHARAYALLTPEDRQNEECVACHTTGRTVKRQLLEGVQCEACHGAGADYRKTKIMKDKELAIENGLIELTTEVCQKCHNESAPAFGGVDYESFIQKPGATHTHPEKKEKEE
ncbi:MAG: cytochrome c3 family protein [candidate division Zixibacteria bacterium]|nr:cytochrome c3 family protein [candidate division Zixibacteria bacterium]